jgi:hypothetical protein
MVSSKITWHLSTSKLDKGLDPSWDIVETTTRNKVKHQADTALTGRNMLV